MRHKVPIQGQKLIIPLRRLYSLLAANQPDKQVEWNDIVHALYGLIQVPAVQGWTKEQASWISNYGQGSGSGCQRPSQRYAECISQLTSLVGTARCFGGRMASNPTRERSELFEELLHALRILACIRCTSE